MSQSDRKNFMSHEGPLIFGDVNDRIMQDMPDQTDKINGREFLKKYQPRYSNLNIVKQNQPGTSLWATCIYLEEQHITPLREDYGNYKSKFFDRYDISKDEMSQLSTYTFSHGFGDLDFPWFAASAVANICIQACIQEGVISKNQYERTSLKDWSEVLISPWFQNVLHSLAITSNGAFGSYGEALINYEPEARYLTSRLNKAVESNYKIHATNDKELIDVSKSEFGINISLSKEAVKALHSYLTQKSNSVGCPAARSLIKLTRDNDNPHLKRILDQGLAEVIPERTNQERITIKRHQTPIEVSIGKLATLLLTYEENFGTPVIEPRKWSFNTLYKLKHRRPKHSNIARIIDSQLAK